ncbi:MAG: hypothetical protein ABI402_02065 [Ferruginibacter sp.]
MKTFIRKHLGTLVMGPAFTFYIFFLPAKKEIHNIKEDTPRIHETELQIKNSSLVSDLDLSLRESWIFRFGADQ